MINIISKSYNRAAVSGPKKVVDNLIAGLKQINYPFVVNRRLDACQRLWIHDDIEALSEIKHLPPEIKVVIGPNLFIKPAQVPKGLDLSRAIFLQPSKWAAAFWKSLGYDGSYKIEVWPVGINTDEYRESPLPKDLVLVYFKQRFPQELAKVEDALRQRHLKFKVLRYGSYLESEFKRLLARSRYAIWLGRHETQGIALEEVLACNVPVLLCDVKTVGHWLGGKKEMLVFSPAEKAFSQATSAEYFSPDCGIRIYNLDDFSIALNYIERNITAFAPRKFIMENLSLEKQAADFVKIYQKYFNLTFQEGLHEKVLKKGDWVNRDVKYRLTVTIKDMAKLILRKF